MNNVKKIAILSLMIAVMTGFAYAKHHESKPDATLRLSAFYYYGTPLLHGLPLGDMLVVLAAGIVALVLASVRFVRKDIGR